MRERGVWGSWGAAVLRPYEEKERAWEGFAKCAAAPGLEKEKAQPTQRFRAGLTFAAPLALDVLGTLADVSRVGGSSRLHGASLVPMADGSEECIGGEGVRIL